MRKPEFKSTQFDSEGLKFSLVQHLREITDTKISDTIKQMYQDIHLGNSEVVIQVFFFFLLHTKLKKRKAALKDLCSQELLF